MVSIRYTHFDFFDLNVNVRLSNHLAKVLLSNFTVSLDLQTD